MKKILEKLNPIIQKVKAFWNDLSPMVKKGVIFYLILVTVLVIAWIYWAYHKRQKFYEEHPEIAAEMEKMAEETQADSLKKLEGEGKHGEAHGESHGEGGAHGEHSANGENASDSTQENTLVYAEDDKAARMELIDLYFSQDTPEKSIKHIEKLSVYYQEDPEFLSKAGKTYLSLHNTKEALRYLEKAFELKKSDVEVGIDLSSVYLQLGKKEKALKLLNDLMHTHPENVDLHIRNASVLGEINPSDTLVMDLFKHILKENPESAEAWYQFGRLMMNQGNYFSALNVLQKAQKLDGLETRIISRIGMAYFYLKKYREAEQYYRTALSVMPKDYNTWYNLGELYLQMANEESSVENVQKLKQKALNCYLETLKKYPAHAAAHFRCGVILNGNLQFKEALLHLNKSYDKNPTDSRVLIQMAIAYESLNEIEEARESLDRAHDYDPLNRVIIEKKVQFYKKYPPKRELLPEEQL